MEPTSTEPQFQPYPDVYRSLMSVGLLGCIYGRREDAQVIDAAVEATLVDPLQYRVNRAVAQGLGGDSTYASETLGKHLEQHPQDDGAKVVLAVSMMLGGDPAWKPLIDSVLASTADPTAREAANGVITYLKSLS